MKKDQVFWKECLFLKRIMQQIYNQMIFNKKINQKINNKTMLLIYQIFLITKIRNKIKFSHYNKTYNYNKYNNKNYKNKKNQNKIYIKTYNKIYNKTCFKMI